MKRTGCGVLLASCLLASTGLLASVGSHADTVRVAVATNFRTTLATLVRHFEGSSPHTVRSSAGSTGKLYSQILHGAPYDIFLSADTEHPTLLVANKQAAQQFTYALGRLALVGASGLQPLANGNFQRLATANPKLAPYGRAAQQTIEHLEINQDKLVYGENVGQAMAIYATGNADLALLALAQLRALQQLPQPQHKSWLIPQDMHTPIRQDAVLLQAGLQSSAAAAFYAFLRSAEARSIIIKSGYHPVG